MNTSDVISSILAGLTFLGIAVALFLGVRSIRDARDMRKAQYKENVAEDILSWLFSYTGFESRYNISNLSEEQQVVKDTASAKSHYSIIAGNKTNDCQALINRGNILAGHFQDKESLLPKKIGEFNSKLRILADTNSKYRISFLELPTSPADFPKVTALLNSYNDEAEKVHADTRELTATIMKEAIKLKGASSFL